MTDPNTPSLRGKTLFITGASRGIGLSIALRAARDGANVVIAAKTTEAHPKLPGTIYSAAEQVREAGGQGLPCVVDVRSEEQVAAAVQSTIDAFGGIDVVVNNASAIQLTGTLHTDMKRYDLMHNVNTRGTFLVSKLALPHLFKSSNPHILNISPPLNMEARWFAPHVAYTMAKYGMSMCVLGMAKELAGRGVGVNALWPRTAIATAAVGNLLGGQTSLRRCRTPEIMADAAHAILVRSARDTTGNFFVDEDVLRAEGISDLSPYRCDATVSDEELLPDFFL